MNNVKFLRTLSSRVQLDWVLHRPRGNWSLETLLEVIIRNAFRKERFNSPIFTHDRNAMRMFVSRDNNDQENGRTYSPLWAWIRQAVEQILHGTTQIEMTILAKKYNNPTQDAGYMEHLVQLNMHIQLYVPRLRVGLLGFVRDEMSPDVLPDRKIGYRNNQKHQDLWNLVQASAITVEKWAHDWFE